MNRTTAAAAACMLVLTACGGSSEGVTAGPEAHPPGQAPMEAVHLRTFQPAALAVGQGTFDDNIGRTGAEGLSRPMHAVVAPGGTFYVSDSENHRVLIFAQLPTANGASAIGVLGQPDLVTGAPPAGTARDNFRAPRSLSVAAGKLAVTDGLRHRVLVYNTLPTASGALPDVVVGQADFSASVRGCAADRLNFPESSFLTPDGKLLVADTGNNRVLIWNQSPTTHGQAPDRVLGQGRLDTCAANDDDQDGTAAGSPTARTMWQPAGVWSDGHRLVVLDSLNNRVLIWNQFPTSNFQAADLVLGQGSFTMNRRNDDDQDGTYDGAPTARTLSGPYLGVASDGTRLAISDGTNRVLAWNAWPTRNFQPADVVLGQTSFSGVTENDDDQDGTRDPQPTARTLYLPYGLSFHNGRLLVADSANNRVLAFDPR